MTISKTIQILPAPFSTIGSIIWDGIEKDDEGNVKIESANEFLMTLERIQDNNEESFAQISAKLQTLIKNNASKEDIRAIGEEIRNSTQPVIDVVNSQTERLMQRLERIRDDLRKYGSDIKKLEEKISDEFAELRERSYEFDFSIPAERLLFYMKMQIYLNTTSEIFERQGYVADKLISDLRRRHKEYTSNSVDKGDWIMETVRNMKKAQIAMEADEQRMFNLVKEVTKDTRKFNLYAKDLLSHNKEFFQELPRLKELLEHFSWWQTKYELLKNNENMCLIYTDPIQKKGFPIGIDDEISIAIQKLKSETRLNY